jgi:UDP-N-acetyl-2-amino-2-deoxyglucuronate dehydrogenase
LSATNTIYFILIGAGRIAARHAEHINKQGKLLAVCDIIETKAKALAEQYSVPYYTNHTKMLEEIKEADVVSVCTPNGLHAIHSIDALKHGFHVLCEKPMAISSEDCREMINTAALYNKQLFIVKQNRFNPPVIALKKALDEKRLGKIYSIQLACFWNRDKAYYKNSWKGTKQLDGGTLYTQFSHFIDLLYWMFGDVKAVQSFLKNSAHQEIIEFEDSGVVALEFKNGIIGTINYTVNAYKKNMEGSLTVFGEKGTVKIGGQYLNELVYQEIEDYVITGLPAGNPPNNYGQYEGSMSNHGEVYKNLISILNSKADLATNSLEGLKTVEIIEKIYQSAIIN